MMSNNRNLYPLQGARKMLGIASMYEFKGLLMELGWLRKEGKGWFSSNTKMLRYVPRHHKGMRKHEVSFWLTEEGLEYLKNIESTNLS